MSFVCQPQNYGESVNCDVNIPCLNLPVGGQGASLQFCGCSWERHSVVFISGKKIGSDPRIVLDNVGFVSCKLNALLVPKDILISLVAC